MIHRVFKRTRRRHDAASARALEGAYNTDNDIIEWGLCLKQLNKVDGQLPTNDDNFLAKTLFKTLPSRAHIAICDDIARLLAFIALALKRTAHVRIHRARVAPVFRLRLRLLSSRRRCRCFRTLSLVLASRRLRPNARCQNFRQTHALLCASAFVDKKILKN